MTDCTVTKVSLTTNNYFFLWWMVANKSFAGNRWFRSNTVHCFNRQAL